MTSFSDLGLSPELLQAVSDSGYTQPTPIQEQAIPYVLMGRDVLGCAQTGTGKTAGFTLPMIDILAQGRARARMPRSLILEPTRELATQVAESFERYGAQHKLTQALLIGGESMAEQEKRLDRGVDVLIATPGRLLDLFERGKILMSDVRILVIDEADRMLDMGFIPDVERIVSLLPRIRQTLFFSATMPPEIRRLADAFLTNPKTITVAPPASPAATVTQALVVVDELDKRETLRRLIRSEDVKNAIIFCNRKRDVDILFRSLQKHGFDAAALHGDMPQSRRTETLEAFKRSEIRLLVASDVAARGLDVDGLSHVFNFDVPHHAEDYVHRIGRTGRAGREGRSFTLAMGEEGKAVSAIERLIGRAIPRIDVDGIPSVELTEEDRPRGRGRGTAPRRASGGRPERGERRARPAPRQPEEIAPMRAEALSGEDRSDEARPQEARGDDARPARRERRPDRRREERRADAAPPQPVQQPVRQHSGREGAPAALAPVVQFRPDRGPRPHPRREREPDDVPVLAFGDHTPAFLLRAAPRRA
ncbi:MAG: DEAD/DEAH box helicase [Alphaproteobacteria bacterium]